MSTGSAPGNVAAVHGAFVIPNGFVLRLARQPFAGIGAVQ
jgi:hypothetical protein